MLHIHCKALLGALALVMLGVTAQPALAAPPNHVYNAVADFSILRNPNGAWSYRSGSSLLGYVSKSCDTVRMACRWNGRAVCNSAIVGASRTHGPLAWLTLRVPGDHLEMDPEGIPNVTVRWTAPAPGSFEIQGDFLGIDTTGNAHPVGIVSNARKLYSNTIASYGQKAPFDLKLKVARGQKVDFIVSTGNTCEYLSTGLKATIKP